MKYFINVNGLVFMNTLALSPLLRKQTIMNRS